VSIEESSIASISSNVERNARIGRANVECDDESVEKAQTVTGSR
jgi:hypothetical protein